LFRSIVYFSTYRLFLIADLVPITSGHSIAPLT
jgi:hypothetical protein